MAGGIPFFMARNYIDEMMSVSQEFSVALVNFWCFFGWAPAFKSGVSCMAPESNFLDYRKNGSTF